MTTLILDESPDVISGQESRANVRRRLTEMLERPFEQAAAEQYDRERWGLSDEAIAAGEVKDRMFSGATYELAAPA